MGYEISRALGAPLDVFVSRKLGAPGQPEFGIGAVAAGGVRVLNEDVVRRLGIPDDYVQEITAQELAEVGRRLRYQGRETRDGSGRADRDPGRRRPRYGSDGPRRTSPAIEEAETPGPGSARMRGPDRRSLCAHGGRSGLPGVSFGPRGHRILVQELRADLGPGGRGPAREQGASEAQKGARENHPEPRQPAGERRASDRYNYISIPRSREVRDMCGRYTLSTPAGRLAEEFQLGRSFRGPYAELQRRPHAGGCCGSGGGRE